VSTPSPRLSSAPGRKFSTRTSAFPVRRPEVHGRGLFPPIHRQEVRGFAVQRRRLPAARKIASARILDLDDTRPEVRENHRRERAREDARQVENDDAFERRPFHLRTEAA